MDSRLMMEQQFFTGRSWLRPSSGLEARGSYFRWKYMWRRCKTAASFLLEFEYRWIAKEARLCQLFRLIENLWFG